MTATKPMIGAPTPSQARRTPIAAAAAVFDIGRPTHPYSERFTNVNTALVAEPLIALLTRWFMKTQQS